MLLAFLMKRGLDKDGLVAATVPATLTCYWCGFPEANIRGLRRHTGAQHPQQQVKVRSNSHADESEESTEESNESENEEESTDEQSEEETT